jgi:2,3-bisphosphoglycerate-independent phosphoglycerate mutase
MRDLEFLSRLAQPAATKIVLLVLDGVGDLRTATQPQTALDRAATPHLDALAREGSLGRLVPVLPGVTPGSGPGHLGLFGYDPTLPEVDIGRGVLEALGLGLDVAPGDVCARGNFATADAVDNLTDRRAGRIPTAESQRLCTALQTAVGSVDGVSVSITAGESHRFVLILRGAGLSSEVADTDPQRLGVPPLAPRAEDPAAAATARVLTEVIARCDAVLADEPRANRILLRGFSRLPHLPQLGETYKMRYGAFAGYPLYRGVAAACGMKVVPCGKHFAEVVAAVAERWQDFDFFFLHVKQTDAAGEDGDVAAKAAVLEEVDRGLPELLALGPDVVAVTGDHSTPAPMKAHSWHPIPLLVRSPLAFVDDCTAFHEQETVRGHLGDLRSHELMGMLLAHAGRLAKFGA